MKEKKSDLARKALLAAALMEFSEHGLAGARVDRIAIRAGSNKGLIYRYFGTKEELFEATYLLLVLPRLTDIPLDPFDLVGFVESLFDAYQSEPEILRILGWYRLEPTSVRRVDLAIADAMRPIEAHVYAAQEAGELPTGLSAKVLLTMAVGFAEAPFSATAQTLGAYEPSGPDARQSIRRGTESFLAGLTVETRTMSSGPSAS